MDIGRAIRKPFTNASISAESQKIYDMIIVFKGIRRGKQIVTEEGK